MGFRDGGEFLYRLMMAAVNAKRFFPKDVIKRRVFQDLHLVLTSVKGRFHLMLHPGRMLCGEILVKGSSQRRIEKL